MTKRLYDCRGCFGSGVLNDYPFSSEVEVCPDCEGSGQILATAHEAKTLGLEAPRSKVRDDLSGVK